MESEPVDKDIADLQSAYVRLTNKYLNLCHDYSDRGTQIREFKRWIKFMLDDARGEKCQFATEVIMEKLNWILL